VHLGTGEVFSRPKGPKEGLSIPGKGNSCARALWQEATCCL
jgi:hypothetical protein